MILNLYLLNVCIVFSFHNYYFLNIKNTLNIYIFILFKKIFNPTYSEMSKECLMELNLY
jgi:hypothetical protein